MIHVATRHEIAAFEIVGLVFYLSPELLKFKIKNEDAFKDYLQKFLQ